ncbi:MAG TPA: sugar kinase [Chryseosolibacter sp.]|nr:sugar kinase [Chryseosolibacter sp.]
MRTRLSHAAAQDPDRRIVTLGEIMMRLTPPAHQRFTQASIFEIVFGGSEANVSLALAGMGLTCDHVTRFPNNDLARAAVQFLQSKGVQTTHILYGGDRIGLYFLEHGAMQRSSRIIYDRYHSAFANIEPGMVNWNSVLEGAAWFHWTGITPAISAGAAATCLEALQAARDHELIVSADINYRRNLWRYGKNARDIMPELIGLTDYVVGDIGDFENCVGISGDDYTSASSNMMETFPRLRALATTKRTSPSASHNNIKACLWNGSALLQSREYELTNIVDRIGAGDAFMAGLIYGWMLHSDDQVALDFATAACAWKHSIPGDSNIATVEEIESLMEGINVGKLLR